MKRKRKRKRGRKRRRRRRSGREREREVRWDCEAKNPMELVFTLFYRNPRILFEKHCNIFLSSLE